MAYVETPSQSPGQRIVPKLARVALFSVLSLIGCLGSLGLSQEEPRLFAVTYYYTALEEDYPKGNEVPFLDEAGKVIYLTSAAFRDAAEIEGSARLLDGSVLNVVDREGAKSSWRLVEAIYGIDKRGCPLIPFRSAAVDPRVVPIGSILQLESTVGLLLPDGRQHDGRWYAVDVGASVSGHHVDLFLGAGLQSMKMIRGSRLGATSAANVSIVGRIPAGNCDIPN